MEKIYSLDINTPIETAFSAIDDDEKMKRWLGGQMKIEFERGKRDKESPEGTKFRQKLVGFVDMEGEVIAHKKPVLLGVGLSSKILKGTFFYHLESLDINNTRLGCKLEIADGSAIQKKFIKILFPMINRIVKLHLEEIKKIAESAG